MAQVRVGAVQHAEVGQAVGDNAPVRADDPARCRRESGLETHDVDVAGEVLRAEAVAKINGVDEVLRSAGDDDPLRAHDLDRPRLERHVGLTHGRKKSSHKNTRLQPKG